MEPKFRTSFIPKQPIVERPKERRGSGLFFFATLILFLGSLALSVGAFLYEQYLGTAITRKGEQLERARAAFDPALIEELSRLDSRIKGANALLDKHTALSQFFTFLEQSTLTSVQFADLNFSVLPDGRIAITMHGRARSFSAVALQSDEFARSQFIREPLFSNLDLDQQGNVVFDLSAFVDPSLISYRGLIESSGREL